jgi:CheY-like chemotaxis protein
MSRQLLAFSRKESVHPRITDLNEVVKNFEKILRRLIGEDVELKTDLSKDLPSLFVDPAQMEQIIMNLVVNARDAMPKGGKLTIQTLTACLDEDYFAERGVDGASKPYAVLTVRDTGEGMDKETQAHIFEPFFTTKEQGKGTGLGLSTVYGIVKQNHGFAWVYSEPGMGTTFKVYLPAAPGTAENNPKGEEGGVRLDGTETVLIVEDDSMLREMTRGMLRRHGYTVLEAANGREALEISQKFKGTINLVISDVVMPELNGRRTVESIRRQRPLTKAFYISGYSGEALKNHGIPDSDIPLLEKPFRMEALLGKVRNVLSSTPYERRSQHDNRSAGA